MKLLLKSLLILSLSMFFCLKSEALTFADGYEQSAKKPMVLLLYADWASNYSGHIDILNSLEKKYSDKFNFVLLNIADSEAAAFNSKFHIYPNLPYVLMFKDGGKVSRYIQRSCAIDYSCIESKMKTFAL